MNTSLAFALSVALCTLSSCATTQATPDMANPTPTTSANPLAAESTLPYHAPDFAAIHDSDYMPAFEQAIAEQRAEVRAIADNPAPATFDNTLVALERSGRMLSRVNMAFNVVTSANTDDALQKVQADVAPELASLQDAIYLDPKLFARVESIHSARDSLGLDPESVRLVEWYHDNFVHHGARLSDADKAKLKELNKEESTLSTAFVAKLLAATKAGGVVVDDKAELAGLSDGEIAAAAA
jgi:peptidyl-dipeptidase Dcp